MNEFFKASKTKLLILIAIIFVNCSSEESNQETIFFGDVELRTQEEINEFGSYNYIRVAGSLTINTSIENIDTVIDLSPLNSIELIDSSLNIFRLSNLNEISLNVEEVGGLAIEVENAELINFTSLTKTTLDFINIRNCPNITTISFPSLLSIKAELFLVNNPKVENLNGFSALTSIGLNSETQNRISIQSNDLLSSLNGLANVNTPISFFNLEGNNSLQTLNGLETLMLKDITILNHLNLSDYCSISTNINDDITYDGTSYSNGTANLTILGNFYNPTLQNFNNDECGN